MKTTIEISDELLMHAKRRALEQRTTLRALLEAGLRHVLLQSPVRDSAPYRFPVIQHALKASTPSLPSDQDANALIDALRSERLSGFKQGSAPK